MASTMHRVGDGLAYGAAGAASGLTGMLALARCGGGCQSCLGCAAVGLGVVAVVLVQRLRRRGKDAGEGSADGLA